MLFRSMAVSPNAPFQNGPGAINVPVSIGNVVVHPGDIITGDQDGLTVIPPSQAEWILKKALAIGVNEDQVMETMRTKRTWDRPFVDAKLKELNCQYLD